MSPPPGGTIAAAPVETTTQVSASAPGASLPEVYRSVVVPAGGRFWRSLAAFTGPGYLIAVGYIDPGNWATDIAGGAGFGYALLPVVGLSSLLAIFLQTLSLRLGIATGKDLAQLCGSRYPRPVAMMLWLASEVAIVACDLAEVVGSAIALQLLFGLPFIIGVVATALDVGLVLWLERRGLRYVEALVIALFLVIAACFAFELLLAQPRWHAVAAALLPSRALLADPNMLYVAAGIVGATVMPHNLYLHSAIAQTRAFDPSPQGRRKAIRFATIDAGTALIAAMLVNAAILVLAAIFHDTGHRDVNEIQDAYRLLTPVLGVGASVVFGIALLASGQMSAVSGTLAGQVVMEGFLHWRVSPKLRRVITRGLALVPALIGAGLYGEAGAGPLLIASQVILSLQLSFVVFPLIAFTGNRTLMGVFASGKIVRAAGACGLAVIAVLNGWLVWQTLAPLP